MRPKLASPEPRASQESLAETATLADWQAAAAKAAPGASADSLIWNSPEGLAIRPLYTSADVRDNAAMHGLPGFAPYLRGPQATMYSVKPWTIRQYAGFSTAEASNEFYRRSLADGAQGISVAFDLPTHRGYDSDNPRVAGDVGKAGVAIDTVEDMKILFDRICLDQVSVSMTMSGAVLPVLAAYVVAAEEQGAERTKLSGTIQNDILKEFLVRNTYIYPPEPSMRIVGDVIDFCSRELPRFNSVSISGYHLQEAGAHQALELALTLADGQEYVRIALARGLDVDAFAGRLSFFFGVGMNFYLEIAKLRAARVLWSRIMQRFQPKNPRSLMLRMHCQTSGWSLTAQDPQNNVVRTTIEAMAAVFGGTQSLHTNSMDEAIALPTDATARIARNTQLILQEETHLTHVVDPWGGSFFMERLTHDMAAAAWKIIEEIDALGGMTEAVRTGWAKLRVEACAAEKQARIDSGRDTIVGVNKYRAQDEEPIDFREIDNAAVRETQLRRLAQVRSARDPRRLEAALASLSERAVRHHGNLLEAAIDAMRARATVGEVSDALERVWGRYRAVVREVSGVYSESFAGEPSWESLRQQIRAFAVREGRNPRLLVGKLGQDGHDRGARVVATAFADLGFDVDIGTLFQTPEECARQAIENDVHAVGISTLAAAHKTLVPAILEALRAMGGSDIVVFVGGIIPAPDHEFLYRAGVKGIYGPGTPMLVSAQDVLEHISRARTG